MKRVVLYHSLLFFVAISLGFSLIHMSWDVSSAKCKIYGTEPIDLRKLADITIDDTVNLALGKPVWVSHPAQCGSLEYITDGFPWYPTYLDGSSDTDYWDKGYFHCGNSFSPQRGSWTNYTYIIDLGDVYDIKRIVINLCNVNKI